MRRSLACLDRAPLEVLGLDASRTYSLHAIKDAFHEKAKTLHPDAGGDAEAFKELNNAYEALRGAHTSSTGRDEWHTPSGSGRTAGTPYGETHRYSRAHDTRRQRMYYERYNMGGERRTWDYGDGRTYANQSTAHFYRGYGQNDTGPSGTGFTADEIRRARFANSMYLARRFFFYLVLYGLFFYTLFQYWMVYQRRKGERPRSDAEWRQLVEDPSRPGTKDDDPVDWRVNALRDQRLRSLLPCLRDHWTDAQKESYLRDWNANYAQREAQASHGGPGSWSTGQPPGEGRQSYARSVEPLTRMRSNNNAGREKSAQRPLTQPSPSDSGVEMDDMDD